MIPPWLRHETHWNPKYSLRQGGAGRDPHLRTSFSEWCLLAACHWGRFARVVRERTEPPLKHISVSENGGLNLLNANYTRKMMRDESSWDFVVSYFQTNPYWNSSFCATLSNFKSQSCADWKVYGSKSTRDINHSFSFPSGWLSIRALHNSLWCWSKSATATVFGSHRHRTWSPPGFSTKGLTVLSSESRIFISLLGIESLKSHWNCWKVKFGGMWLQSASAFLSTWTRRERVPCAIWEIP